MKKLTFDELACIKSLQKPWYCHIEVKLDGSHLKEPYMLGAKLKAGDTKDPASPFSKGYYFDDTAAFSMELEDRYQLEVFTHDTNEDTDGTYTATFTHEGNWEVDVEYTVTDVGSVDDLEKAVEEFRAGIQAAEDDDSFTRWFELSHGDIVDRAETLGVRVGNVGHADVPAQYGIDQADLGYCGLVAIMFVSAYRQPRRFVETCRSLYETGGFLTKNTRVESSRALQYSPIGDDMHDLEWLYCASLFETRSDIDEVTASEPEPDENGTYIKDFRNWFIEVIGFQTVWNFNEHPLLDERVLFDKAVEATTNDGAAVFHCSSDLATDAVLLSGEDPWFNVSDHAVAMVLPPDVGEGDDPNDPDDDPILFTFHSWGESKFGSMEWDRLHDYLDGGVVGWSS